MGMKKRIKRYTTKDIKVAFYEFCKKRLNLVEVEDLTGMEVLRHDLRDIFWKQFVKELTLIKRDL